MVGRIGDESGILSQLRAEDQNASMEDDNDVMDQLEEIGESQRRAIEKKTGVSFSKSPD